MSVAADMSLGETVPNLAGVASPNTKRPAFSPRPFVLNSTTTIILLDLFCLLPCMAGVFAEIHMRLGLDNLGQSILVILITLGLNFATLYSTGSYRRDAVMNPGFVASRLPTILILSGIAMFLILHYAMSFLFPTVLAYRSNSRCLTIVLVTGSLSLIAYMFSRAIFRGMIRRHWFRRRILVVGTGARARHLDDLMNHDRNRGVAELLFVADPVIGTKGSRADSSSEDNAMPATVPIDGRSLDRLANDVKAEEIVVAVDERRGLSVEHLLACKAGGIAVTSYPAFLERETERVDLRWLEQSWLVYSGGFQMGDLDRVLKRATDILGSACGLLIGLLPLMVAAVAIKIEGRGPILFVQERVTQGGRTFKLIKLRTMVPTAEKSGPKWAELRDRRVTRVGAFLRRTRIDELPQLVNVLRGDMSLVGPRPERPVFTKQLAESIPLYNLRHTVKAGLTGWAQVNYPYGASIADARSKLEYDLYYIKNYRFLLDVFTVLQTLKVLLWAEGVR